MTSCFQLFPKTKIIVKRALYWSPKLTVSTHSALVMGCGGLPLILPTYATTTAAHHQPHWPWQSNTRVQGHRILAKELFPSKPSVAFLRFYIIQWLDWLKYNNLGSKQVWDLNYCIRGRGCHSPIIGYQITSVSGAFYWEL